MRANTRALALASLLLAPSAVRALPDESPRRWLAKALAGPSRPYEGKQRTTVTAQSGSVSSQVTVSADGRGAVRRVFESGPAEGVILLQTGGTTYQRSRDGAYQALPAVEAGDPAAIARQIVANYRVSFGGYAQMLSRKAVLIKVAARYPYNPSRTLLIDHATGLILRDELFAPNGKRRSLSEFISVRFVPQPASSFAPPAGAAPTSTAYGPASFSSRSSAKAVESETGRPVPTPAHVPPGFRVTTFGVMTTGSGWKTPAVRYGDGLASFTIFVRGSRPGLGGPRGRGRGPGPHRFGRGGGSDSVGDFTSEEDVQRSVITHTTRSAVYIAIGDIAASELARVVRSLP